MPESGANAPERLCPLRYRHGPDAIARAPERPATILYVIGGLYGNLPALVAIEAMAGAESLAGWRFDPAALDDRDQHDWHADAFARSEVDVFASTHTCQAALRMFDRGERKLVANNGAAGMPNASGTHFGILTRIATTPSPHPSLYGRELRGAYIDALAINYDEAAWRECFLANWPEGSPAWLSYFNRIVNGPASGLPQFTTREEA
jgi:hypothetical protein